MKPFSLPVSLELDRGTMVYSMGDVRTMFTLKGSKARLSLQNGHRAFRYRSKSKRASQIGKDIRAMATLLILGAFVSSFFFCLLDFQVQQVSASHIHWSIEVLDGGGSDATGWHTSIAVDSDRNPHISYLYLTGADLMYAKKTSGQWKIEALDTAGQVGWHTSITLDAGGNSHISYVDHQNGDLKYAKKTSVPPFLVIETVDQPYNVWWTSIAVDKAGRPHIAYVSVPSFGADSILKYAVRDGATWNKEEISSSKDMGLDVSLALDSNDAPHITFASAPGTLSHAFKESGVWFMETAVQVVLLDVQHSIATDSQDNLHLSYVDRSVGVKYAVRRGGVWTNETVATPAELGTSNDIAADSLSSPHVCYFNRSNDDLTYAAKSGSVWIHETVDSDVMVGADCSITTDQSDVPHISYRDVTNRNLKYATIVNGTWNLEVVDKGIEDDVGRYSSIALDMAGRPHIGYFDDTNDDLKYVYRDPMGSWNVQRVDEVDAVGWSTSIVIDSTGEPHFSYFDMTHEDLKYARGPGFPWFNETVDSAGSVGSNTSIAIDSNNSIHIAYYDFSNGDLKYANDTLGSWSVEIVDSVGDVGLYPSLIIDSSGRIHISYFNASSKSLKYAFRNGGPWSIETIDSSGDVGYWTSISLDFKDEPRVSYYDSTNGNLKHAYHESGMWSTETVDATGDVGLFSSLGIDLNNKAHIAYYDRTYGDLRYSTDISGSWESEIVAFSGDVGRYASIAVDSVGNPHISYYDESNGNLNCAFGEILADLVVTPDDITLTPSNSVANGTLVRIDVVVRNVGYADAFGVYVRFFDGDPVLGDQIGSDRTIGFVPHSGGIGQTFKTWIATPRGNHEICVIADPDDSIRESDESNNQACVPIEVLGPPPPMPPTNLSAVLGGENLQNVTLSWNLSPDDAGGANNVVAYYIYRNASFDPDGAGYEFYDSVPDGTSEYTDVLAGEGDSSNRLYRICAVDSSNDSSCSSNQAAKFTRPLSKGPSLVSIPLIQTNESIETVLQTVQHDKAWYYDSSSQEWKWLMKSKGYRRGLWSVNHTMGLWVNVTSNCNLTVAGVVPTNTSIRLHSGWNLVGFPSFNPTYTVFDLKAEGGSTRVEGFDASMVPYHLRVLGVAEVLQTGYGYWVRVEAETVWTLDIG